MKVKNAINSEECNDLRNLIGQVNAVVGRINRIAEDEDELHKAADSSAKNTLQEIRRSTQPNIALRTRH